MAIFMFEVRHKMGGPHHGMCMNESGGLIGPGLDQTARDHSGMHMCGQPSIALTLKWK